MNNNDKLVRVRYGLDIKDSDMEKIFQFGGLPFKKEAIQELLTRVPTISTEENPYPENQYVKACDLLTLESFFNGLITFKRGKKPLKEGEVEQPPVMLMTYQNINNVMLKKLKIALALTSDNMLTILAEAGVVISTSELSAIMRKEGHRNYQMCGDKFARNFLKGLAICYRS